MNHNFRYLSLIMLSLILTLLLIAHIGCSGEPANNELEKPEPANQVAGVDNLIFLTKRGYISDNKCPSIVGELKNNSDFSIGDILLSAYFYCSSGKLMGGKEDKPAIVPGTVELEILEPNQISPYKIFLSQETIKTLPKFDIDKLNQYRIEVTSFYATDKALYRDFEITQSKGELNTSTGFYTLSGGIKNAGGTVAIKTKVIGVFYDHDNKIIDVMHVYLQEPLIPGIEAQFVINVTDKMVSERIDHYVIQGVTCEKCD